MKPPKTDVRKSQLIEELSALILCYNGLKKQLASGKEINLEELRNLDRRKAAILERVHDLDDSL